MPTINNIRPNLPRKPQRFMDKLRAFIRSKNLAYKTEKTYCFWIKRYIKYHNLQSPHKLSDQHVEQFLHHLAIVENVGVGTQKTALNALAFLYNQFLEQPLGSLNITKAKVQRRIPSVFSHREAQSVIQQLTSPYSLMAKLMYGSGLRTSEVISLRVKDIDFEHQMIIVRYGKGNKDRRTVLPESLCELLKQQIKRVALLHKEDTTQGFGEVYLPFALARKYPSAAKELAWQYLFPSTKLSTDPRSKRIRRHHVYDRSLQRNFDKHK